jgi:lipopolysaccharide/colanic/teichoic acid biosynthesis glycosyltransferase
MTGLTPTPHTHTHSPLLPHQKTQERASRVDSTPCRVNVSVNTGIYVANVDVILLQSDTSKELQGPSTRSLWYAIYLPFKSVMDIVLGTLLLVLFAPIILLTAGAVRMTSHGPAFYMQTRVGKNGRHFKIYKLRTMYHNCEQTSGARWSVPGDSRITPLGAFLRITHLDELPQLVNVLRGEMSLVGPRPERPEIIKTLEVVIPRYRERLQVRPGVTGLAQLRLPSDSSIESVREKLVYDLHYIQVLGPWLDLRLITCTLFKMCKLPLTTVLSYLRVPGDQAVASTKQYIIAATTS